MEMTTIDKYPESKTVIRFQDCDAFGHLNNARFINYFINAREDHLREYYAFDLYEHAKASNQNWFITRHEISYLRPAQLGETVTIKTRLIQFTNNTLMVEGAMFDAAGLKLKAVQWTTFRYVDLQRGRSAMHPEPVAALLASLVVDGLEKENLDKGIAEIKLASR